MVDSLEVEVKLWDRLFARDKGSRDGRKNPFLGQSKYKTLTSVTIFSKETEFDGVRLQNHYALGHCRKQAP